MNVTEEVKEVDRSDYLTLSRGADEIDIMSTSNEKTQNNFQLNNRNLEGVHLIDDMNKACIEG
jgi:hypothetical protein